MTYPVAFSVEGLAQPTDVQITAINNNIISLKDVQHTDSGFQFTWDNYNPTEYPLKVNIGIPPVVCDDGIIYGFYQSPDLASHPLTPAGGHAEWTTKVAVPAEAHTCYILLSVETNKQRFYLNHLIDITDK